MQIPMKSNISPKVASVKDCYPPPALIEAQDLLPNFQRYVGQKSNLTRRLGSVKKYSLDHQLDMMKINSTQPRKPVTLKDIYEKSSDRDGFRFKAHNLDVLNSKYELREKSAEAVNFKFSCCK